MFARRAILVLLLTGCCVAGARSGVQLTNFSATILSASRVRLDWNTSTEVNNWGFEIQRSPDGQGNYQTLPGALVPGAGTTSLPQSYTFTDSTVFPGTWFYRLRQIDLDGTPHYVPGIPAHVRVVGEYPSVTGTRLLLHFNESSGSLAYDASGNDNNGIISGTTVGSSRFLRGRSFAVQGDIIRIPDAVSLRPSQFTIEAWINPFQMSLLDRGTIVGKKNGSTTLSFRLQAVGASGRVVFAAGSDSVVSSSTLLDNRWYHIAGTFDGAMLRLYINGERDADPVAGSPIGYSSRGVFIGQDSSDANIWLGMIDEVRLSDAALTPEAFNLQLPPVNLQASALAGSIHLTWTNGGGLVGPLLYRVYRGQDSIAMVLIDSSAVPDFVDSSVHPDSTYFYRVSAIDSSGFESGRSTALSIEAAPPAPILVSPVNAAIVRGLDTTLVWRHSSPSVSGYWLELSTDSLFTLTNIDSTLTDTTGVVSGLQHGQRYWWRVRARNISGWGGYSEIRVFEVRFAVAVPLIAGWNLLSLPVQVDNDSLMYVYPMSILPYAFSFHPTSGYQQQGRIQRGTGYWAKFSAAHSEYIEGSPVLLDSIQVLPGWNIIGALSFSCDTSAIATDPPGLLGSGFFGFSGSYQSVAQLLPGAAYWVKAHSAGTIILSQPPPLHRR